MPIHCDEGMPAGRSEPVRLNNEAYSKALSGLVVNCTDLLPVRRTQAGFEILLGLRDQDPMRGWWLFGGRQQWRMAPTQSLQKRIEAELGLSIETDRFTFIDVASLPWKTRAQAPIEDGCHMSSWVYGVVLNGPEVQRIRPNEEYEESDWFTPKEIADGDFHQAVKHMTQLYVSRLRHVMREPIGPPEL